MGLAPTDRRVISLRLLGSSRIPLFVPASIAAWMRLRLQPMAETARSSLPEVSATMTTWAASARHLQKRSHQCEDHQRQQATGATAEAGSAASATACWPPGSEGPAPTANGWERLYRHIFV